MVSLFFGFNGRINRLQYWLGNVVTGVAGFVCLMLAALIAGPAEGEKIDPGAQALKTMLVMAPVWAGTAWMSLALQVKRFHDRGRSGYFALAPLVPMVVIFTSVSGGVLADAPAEQVVPGTLLWFFILGCINLWFLIDLGTLGGSREANRFGEPPGSGLSPGRGARPAGASSEHKAAQGSSVGGAGAAMEMAIRGQQQAARAPSPALTPGQTPAPANFKASSTAQAGGSAPSFGKRVAR
jgi:uncharacterized membrane protein YhaH (DUF805 family)